MLSGPGREGLQVDRDDLAGHRPPDDVDVVPIDVLRDERGDDLGVVSLDEDVTAVTVQVPHEGMDRQALLWCRYLPNALRSVPIRRSSDRGSGQL